MDRLTLRMLPAEIRARHGVEIEEMLAVSARPIRDGTDVVIAGVGLGLGRATLPLFLAAVAGIVVSAIGLVHAVLNLQNGVVEIADHWWSTFIAAGLAGSLFIAVVLGLAHRHASAWRTRVR